MFDQRDSFSRTFGTTLPDVGLFTWDLTRDVIYSDRVVAALYGFDPHEAQCGLSLTTFLDRVHPDDAPGFALKISNSIAAQQHTEKAFRVKNHAGEYAPAVGFGRCFRNRADEPVAYAGLVMPRGQTRTPAND